MRCPKCGFISFDDQSTCGKCSHSLAETAGQLHGTSIHVDSPAFLNPLFERAAGNAEINADAGGEAAEEEVALDLSAEGEIEAESEAEESGVSFEGLDVSDLVPEQEESPSGLAMEAEESSAEFSQEDSVLELESEEEYELDLGGESSADEEESPSEEVEGVVDLSVLMGGEEEAGAEEPEAAEALLAGAESDDDDDEDDALELNLDDGAEPAMEDLSLDDLSLDEYEEDDDDEDSRGEPDDEMELSLETEDEEPATDPQGAGTPGSGLTLEKDDK